MTITDDATSEQSPRLQAFKQEVERLKVTGGRANPERTGKILGVLLQAAGVVVTVVAYLQSNSTSNPLTQRDAMVLALIGVTVTVIGTGMFVVFSLTRYLRFWLVRLIYEHRDQTDRLLAGPPRG